MGILEKEFVVNPFFTLGIDLKTTFAGGKPYTPVLESESIAKGEVVFDTDKSFSEKHANCFRTDLKIYYKINAPKTYMTFAIDFQNLTNHENIYSRNFNTSTGNYSTFFQQRFFPMFTFELLF